MCEGLCESEAHQGVLGECRRRADVQDSLGTTTALHSELHSEVQYLTTILCSEVQYQVKASNVYSKWLKQ